MNPDTTNNNIPLDPINPTSNLPQVNLTGSSIPSIASTKPVENNKLQLLINQLGEKYKDPNDFNTALDTNIQNIKSRGYSFNKDNLTFIDNAKQQFQSRQTEKLTPEEKRMISAKSQPFNEPGGTGTIKGVTSGVIREVGRMGAQFAKPADVVLGTDLSRNIYQESQIKAEQLAHEGEPGTSLGAFIPEAALWATGEYAGAKIGIKALDLINKSSKAKSIISSIGNILGGTVGKIGATFVQPGLKTVAGGTALSLGEKGQFPSIEDNKTNFVLGVVLGGIGGILDKLGTQKMFNSTREGILKNNQQLSTIENSAMFNPSTDVNPSDSFLNFLKTNNIFGGVKEVADKVNMKLFGDGTVNNKGVISHVRDMVINLDQKVRPLSKYDKITYEEIATPEKIKNNPTIHAPNIPNQLPKNIKIPGQSKPLKVNSWSSEIDNLRNQINNPTRPLTKEVADIKKKEIIKIVANRTENKMYSKIAELVQSMKDTIPSSTDLLPVEMEEYAKTINKYYDKIAMDASGDLLPSEINEIVNLYDRTFGYYKNRLEGKIKQGAVQATESAGKVKEEVQKQLIMDGYRKDAGDYLSNLHDSITGENGTMKRLRAETNKFFTVKKAIQQQGIIKPGEPGLALKTVGFLGGFLDPNLSFGVSAGKLVKGIGKTVKSPATKLMVKKKLIPNENK